MFKISSLEFEHPDGRKHEYTFKYGVNYFYGKNDVGKTQFSQFIDFMFGKDLNIKVMDWYKQDMKKAKLSFQYRNQSVILTRTLDSQRNFIEVVGKQSEPGPINLERYKKKLNRIFMKEFETAEELEAFTEEALTYRTYTMFNFLEEEPQGRLYNFFSKLQDSKYRFKVQGLMNYLFNPYQQEVKKLQIEIKELEQTITEKKMNQENFKHITNKINESLLVLGIYDLTFKGENGKEIMRELEKVKRRSELKVTQAINKKDLVQLESEFNEVEEQLKLYQSVTVDFKESIVYHKKRNKLLQEFDNLLQNESHLTYLIEPLKEKLEKSETTIVLSDYLVKNETKEKLRKRKKALRTELIQKSSSLQRFDLNEKERAVAVIEEYLIGNSEYVQRNDLLVEMERELGELKKELRDKLRAEDKDKIETVSNNITKYYLAASKESDFVSKDSERDLQIELVKNNILLNLTVKNNDENNSREEYTPGSLARHTLIQLATYLSFLEFLIKEDKHPLIPILIIDHISKPFDGGNMKGIGKVLEKFFEDVSKQDCQIIILDRASSESLGVHPNKEEPLEIGSKTGFSPFYKNK